jgi:hypothetical protein
LTSSAAVTGSGMCMVSSAVCRFAQLSARHGCKACQILKRGNTLGLVAMQVFETSDMHFLLYCRQLDR